MLRAPCHRQPITVSSTVPNLPNASAGLMASIMSALNFLRQEQNLGNISDTSSDVAIPETPTEYFRTACQGQPLSNLLSTGYRPVSFQGCTCKLRQGCKPVHWPLQTDLCMPYSPEGWVRLTKEMLFLCTCKELVSPAHVNLCRFSDGEWRHTALFAVDNQLSTCSSAPFIQNFSLLAYLVLCPFRPAACGTMVRGGGW